MPSIEYQGMKFTGGKFFFILSLIGAIIGGGWTGYKFYDDYLDMKAKIEEYTAPDHLLMMNKSQSLNQN